MISKKDIFTIPNLLSFLRLGLVPVYTFLYLHGRIPPASIILAISCLTDLLDGFIARRFHMVSDFGKFLDPLADKITQLALIFCLSTRYPLVKSLVPLFLAKEVTQSGLAYYHLRHGKILSGALLTGKISTAILFSSFLGLMVFPELAFRTVKTLVLMDSLVMILSLGSYFLAYRINSPKLCDT